MLDHQPPVGERCAAPRGPESCEHITGRIAIVRAVAGFAEPIPGTSALSS
jgi:hypothetical protein